jgi:hypothetical protein
VVNGRARQATIAAIWKYTAAVNKSATLIGVTRSSAVMNVPTVADARR